MTDDPQTLIEAVRYFSDLKTCNAYLLKIKWPDGKPVCPKCGGKSVHELASRPGLLKCNSKACQKQFSLKVGTIFEASPLGLDKWFVAVWSIANCKNGISSHELSRALGVTQKSAWFMLHRIRAAMEGDDSENLTGEVEADETFVGGEAKNMHKSRRERVITGRGGVDKTPVQGIMERGGPMRTFVVIGLEGSTLRGNVLRNVDRLAALYTDSHPSYADLSRSYLHQTVDHAIEFVRGRVHVNGVENFWSLFKRTLKGTYVHVAPFHLFRYCAEQCFRFNNRETDDGHRFGALLSQVLGKRLTFRNLTALGDAGFMGIT